jgi:hypothetical protein
MKEGNEKKIFATITVAIIVLAGFVYFIYRDVNDLNSIAASSEEIGLYAKININENTGLIPFDVNFSSLVLNNKGKLNYSWDFGDGETSIEKETMHTYKENGTYLCKLTVTDSSGKKIIDSIEIFAKRNKPPIAAISINHNTIDRKFVPIIPKIVSYAGNQQQLINRVEKIDPYILGEGQIECYAQVDDPEDDEIVSYEWKVIPSTGVTITGKTVYKSYYFNGSYIKIPELYTWREGRYVIILTVTDSAGNTANTSMEFQVDKSTKETMRAQRLKLIKDGLASWNLYLNSILGATAAALILKVMKENGFIGLNIAILLISKYILHLENIDDEELINQINLYLEKHPKIKDYLETALETIQIKLAELKSKYPDKASDIDKTIDSIEMLLENLGLRNKRPVVTDPYPAKEAINIDCNLSKVFITINDPEGDPFNVRIHGNYISEVLLTNRYNSTFNAIVATPLPAKSEIFWHVNVSNIDGSKWINNTYMFTTFYE